jgi:selenium metabolism protein YedF
MKCIDLMVDLNGCNIYTVSILLMILLKINFIKVEQQMGKVIDCRGLTCPKPVIMTKKELDSMEQGELISIVDNEVAKENLRKLSESLGADCSVEEKDGLYYVKITKKIGSKAVFSDDKNLVILAGSDVLGNGDDTLGRALMKSYLFALSESDTIPKTMLFLNGGVKLTTEGSEVLESLEKLLSMGVEIMPCGTCLDFFKLKDKLVIGTITNMYTIVDKMNSASNTIKL